MASQSFEDLIAWQKARLLVRSVFKEIRTGELSHDFEMKDQMKRASISIMANIAEGQERGSIPDFVRFLWIAKASCGELRSHFYLAKDAGYLSAETAGSLRLQAQVSRIIGGLISSLNSRKHD